MIEELGADLNVKDRFELSPIMLAMQSQQQETVQYLLTKSTFLPETAFSELELFSQYCSSEGIPSLNMKSQTSDEGSLSSMKKHYFAQYV